MNLAWQNYLQSRQAIIQDGRVIHYGDTAAELESARSPSATVLADLSHSGLIRFAGEDAQSFLQGQVSCDISEINSATASYGAYCTPKGRMLASFLMWRDGADYVMQLPSSLQALTQKRLSMYVLRAKVRLTDDNDNLVRLGVSGEHAEKLVKEILRADPALSGIPALKLGMVQGERGSIISLARDRFELAVTPELAPAVWESLGKDAVPVGARCWEWLEIRAGIPVITPPTQEQFVPQMANLDAIGGVSFHKGCYPGQEIVARARYLGKIKRRMYLANIQPEILNTSVKAGDVLFSPDMGNQSAGMVVNAAHSPHSGFDVLAVIQTSSAEAGNIRWLSLDGPLLEIMALPYTVSQ
ncbi:MAG: folate-binding protein YgfZ [Nitrosospira sp.]|nr:folate-binding protein YgfZ [Nitrosospira sp.]